MIKVVPVNVVIANECGDLRATFEPLLFSRGMATKTPHRSKRKPKLLARILCLSDRIIVKLVRR